MDWKSIRRRNYLYRPPELVPGPFGGGSSSASISPYDVPEAVRAFVSDENPSLITIEFRYATAEALTCRKVTPHLSLWIGVNSGRLYRIDTIAEGAKPGDEIRIKIGDVFNAVDVLRKDSTLFKRRANYDITKNIIADRTSAPNTDASVFFRVSGDAAK